MKLTNRQEECLQAIKDYIKENHYPPRHKDIQKIMGLKWPRSVQQLLDVLRKRGLIDWIDGQARTIRIVKKDGD